MNLDRYLSRIGYTGPRTANAKTLRRIHHRHLLTVPFENLDIGRRPIEIDEVAFIRKIVDERRGGFCYELNGAFAALLRELGFQVTLLSARVAGTTGYSPEFDHLALLVEVDGEQRIADVGFGDGFVHPLRLTADSEQKDPVGLFRLRRDGDAFIVERDSKPQYRFTLMPHGLEEYAPRCRWHQTSPESHFMQNTICSMATESGRITLSGRRLITTQKGLRTERVLEDDAEWRAALNEHFGVTLPRGA